MMIKRKEIGIKFQGTIIDIETTGLSPESDEIITLGLLHDNMCEIYQSTGETMNKPIDGIITKVPPPTYAFNKNFEESFLRMQIDCELQQRPYERKWDAIRISSLNDPFLGHGLGVVKEWRAYEIDRDVRHLDNIIAHNESNLISELCLAIVRSRGNSS